MIPKETYDNQEPCLLIATAKFEGKCWLGIMVARESYLGAENRDLKRSVTVEGKRNILWLVEDEPYPASRWEGIDMARFMELRKMKGGAKRATQFFIENVGRKIHRSILESLLFDQDDFTRRLRGDKMKRGARELLAEQDIVLLCGTWPTDRNKALVRGLGGICPDEWLALRSQV